MRNKTLLKATSLLLGTALLCGSLSACGGGSGSDKAKESVAIPDGPLDVYEDPVTIEIAQRTFGDATPTGEDSPWIDKYKEYGINIETAWMADQSQFDEKLNTSIASGDVPDVFQVNAANHMNNLVRSEMVADLTEAYEKYASDRVKERFSSEAGKAALQAATFDGKLRFIPINITESINDTDLLYIRQDWVENLGMEMPTTMEELKELALAFTKNDPDGNGEDDTYGISIPGKDGLTSNFATFFTGYGIYPGAWYDGMLYYSKDKDGNIVWDGEKPEMKEGLQMLQDLYKEGAIPKDFAVYDSNQMWEDCNGGKAGMCIGARGYPAWAIQNTYANNPKAKWYAMTMPAKEGTETLIKGFQPLNAALAVSSECANPEAVIKMLNIVTEINSPDSELYDPFYLEANRTESGDSFMVPIREPDEERAQTERLTKALEAKDSSELNEGDKKVYDNVVLFTEKGEASAWSDWNRFYPESGHAYYELFVVNGDAKVTQNLWQQIPTATMQSKLSAWKNMMDESYVEIISGTDVNQWDTTLETWAGLGGDEIKKEVEAAQK